MCIYIYVYIQCICPIFLSFSLALKEMGDFGREVGAQEGENRVEALNGYKALEGSLAGTCTLSGTGISLGPRQLLYSLSMVHPLPPHFLAAPYQPLWYIRELSSATYFELAPISPGLALCSHTHLLDFCPREPFQGWEVVIICSSPKLSFLGERDLVFSITCCFSCPLSRSHPVASYQFTINPSKPLSF